MSWKREKTCPVVGNSISIKEDLQPRLKWLPDNTCTVAMYRSNIYGSFWRSYSTWQSDEVVVRRLLRLFLTRVGHTMSDGRRGIHEDFLLPSGKKYFKLIIFRYHNILHILINTPACTLYSIYRGSHANLQGNTLQLLIIMPLKQ